MPWAPRAWAGILLRQIRSITDQPIRYIVVSHYHADHIYGLQAFKDHSPAIIIAQERAGEYRENEETADERASQRLDQRREALFPWVDRNTRVVPPDITFRQRVVLNLGGKRFVLILRRAGAFRERHDDDGRARGRAVRRRHRPEQPHSVHERR